MEVIPDIHVVVLELAVKFIRNRDAADGHLNLANWGELALLAGPVHHQLLVNHVLDHILHPDKGGADGLQLPGPLLPPYHQKLQQIVLRLSSIKRDEKNVEEEKEKLNLVAVLISCLLIR